MAISYFNVDVENISNLSDLPNSEEGLSSAEMKATFDRAAVDIKNYINNTLVPQLNATFVKGFEVTFPAGETTYVLNTASYGLNANTIVFCQPTVESQHLWNECNVKCSAVTTNKLTFTAMSAPSSSVTIQVLVFG